MFVGWEKAQASVDLLTQVGDEAGIEPFPEIMTRSSQEHGAVGKKMLSSRGEHQWSCEASGKAQLRDPGASSLGRGGVSPFALSRDAAESLTGFQCPISVFLLPPRADLQ